MKHKTPLAFALLLAASAAVPLLAWAGEGARQTVTVDINGDAHTYTLDDLKDGQTLTVGEGDHAVHITRAGDQLKVNHPALDAAGAEMNMALTGEPGVASMEKKMIFMTDDGQIHDLSGEAEDIEWTQAGEHGAKKVVIIKRQVDGDGEGAPSVQAEVKVIKVELEEEDD